MSGTAQRQPAVSLDGITKRFPGVLANDAVSIDFLPGEIHALLGENGAGKSTLIGILAGMQQPDGGTIRVGGRPTRIGSPRESLALGIGTVFQHGLLVPSLTVLENLMLGGPWWRTLDETRAMARLGTLSATLGITIDPAALVGGLSLGQQQQVEILRALWRGERVLVLDEPTSMLTPKGVEDLGRVMARLRDSGVAIVLVTHKLREAHAFGNRISVLRQGRLVGQLGPDVLGRLSETAATDAIISLMFGSRDGHAGEAATLLGRGRHGRAGTVRVGSAPVLVLDAVGTEAAPGACPLVDVTLAVRPGEILGIAGVDGNGQKHLAEVMAGQRVASTGRVVLDGADVTRAGVGARRRRGMRYVTDERLGEGTVGALSVATNLIAKEIGTAPLWRQGITLWGRVNAHGRDQVARHDIRTPSERTPIGRLSGGNIQKVLLARELDAKATVVVYNKPTYGLDLHNIHLARRRIGEGAAAGLATVLISTELDELIELSDRIAVMLGGRIVGIVDNGADAEQTVGRLMTGVA